MTGADSLDDLIRLVRPLYKALEGAVADGLRDIGLTVTERAVLHRIRDDRPLPVPRIAEALILPRQFVQKTVNALMAAGMVARQRNAAHRRSAPIALTGRGAAVIAGVLAREARVTAGVAAGLRPRDIATARSVIEAMIAGYSEREERR